jgi:hypothetical protein
MERFLSTVLKMAKLLLKAFALVLVFVCLSSRAYAINFGSVAKSDFAQIKSGESAKFTVLFWNAEDDSYVLKLSKEAPENWIVIIDPEEFLLNRTTGEEYISLPSGNVRAKVVNIFVKPDANSKNGNYSVVINSIAELGGNAENVISIVPVRSFNFEISLTGSAASESESKEEVTEVTESTDISEKEKALPENENIDSFYLAMAIVIVVFSIIVYKKS